MSNGLRLPARGVVVRLTAALGVAALLSGCSSVSHVVADHWPKALGGLPDGVPARAETQPNYLPVHDVPPPRDTKKMTPQERATSEAEMAVSRTRSATQAQELKTEAPERLPPIH